MWPNNPSNFKARTQNVLANGNLIRVSTYVHMEDNAPSLVFLHAGLGSIELWRDFPERLANATGSSAIIYERYGHGSSGTLTEPYASNFLETEAEFALLDVLDSLDIRRAIFFGHSDGATIALLFAAAYPDGTIGVISEAAHVIVEPVSIMGVETAVGNFEAGNLEERLERYHEESTREVFYGWANVWLSTEFRGWSMIERLDAITAPVLAVQGEDDDYGTLEQLRLFATHVSGQCETLLLPDCGHSPHAEAGDAVLLAASQFVSTLLVEESVA